MSDKRKPPMIIGGGYSCLGSADLPALRDSSKLVTSPAELQKEISQLQKENEALRGEVARIKNYASYEYKASRVRHHPKCDFLDIEFAECDCGAYIQDNKDDKQT